MHPRAALTDKRFGWPLLAALSLLPMAGCSSDTRIDFHGRAPQVGEVYRDEFTITMTNATMTATGAGISETGQIDMLVEAVDEEETLAVVDGHIAKSRLKVVSEKITDTIRVQGQTETHTEPSPLHGETIQFEKVAGEWQRTLVGKAPSPKQADDLKHFPPPESLADWFPANPVRPGESWTVDVSKLRKLYGTRAQIDSGQCKMTFENKIKKDGKYYAKIAKEIELHGKFKDAKGEWRLDWNFTGATLAPLHPRGVATMKLSGTKTMSTTVTDGGRPLQLTISGPVTVEMKSSRKGE
jgi:hypothetical protein